MSSNWMSGKQAIRYVLLAILGVALVVLAFDWRARTNAQAAYDKLQATDLEQTGTTPDRVHALLNRQPDAPGNEALGELVETYTWTGFRSYTVYVVYTPIVGAASQASYTLDRVTLNQAP